VAVLPLKAARAKAAVARGGKRAAKVTARRKRK
jgi:hypothetical protein